MLEIRTQLLHWFLFSTKVVAGTKCFTGRNLKEETFILASVGRYIVSHGMEVKILEGESA